MGIRSQLLEYVTSKIINLFKRFEGKAYLGPFQPIKTDLFVKLVNVTAWVPFSFQSLLIY